MVVTLGNYPVEREANPSRETLGQAFMRCYGNASATLRSQAHLALMGIKADTALTKATDVRGEHVRSATASWYAAGLSPATINKRLNCLSKMGVMVEGLRVKNPKQLKWHLPEGKKEAVVAWCRLTASEKEAFEFDVLATFIEWTTLTGLRIEESLRLRMDVSFEYTRTPYCEGDKLYATEVRVDGTKTASSQATLPLSFKAGRVVAEQCQRLGNDATSLLFPVTYLELANAWDATRTEFGFTEPTATLKALRRSAARYLHVDCGMPLHMVQQYLRHESMDTTLEYLRLTGGYGTEEMRRFLK